MIELKDPYRHPSHLCPQLAQAETEVVQVRTITHRQQRVIIALLGIGCVFLAIIASDHALRLYDRFHTTTPPQTVCAAPYPVTVVTEPVFFAPNREPFVIYRSSKARCWWRSISTTPEGCTARFHCDRAIPVYHLTIEPAMAPYEFRESLHFPSPRYR